MRIHLEAMPAVRDPAFAAALGAMSAAGVAQAHTVDAAAAGGALDLWSIDPLGAVLLALLAIVYARGQWRVGRRSAAPGVRGAYAACFWAGWLALAIALGPPLEPLTAVSFAAHMVQHELMMLVAAPLLVISRPLGVLVWGLPQPLERAFVSVIQARTVRRSAAWLTAPLAAWLLHAVVLWGWHVPVAFEAGLRSDPVHWLQHVSFFLAAVIFWWSVFAAGYRGERRGVALLSVFTTAIHMTVLGMLLTFSKRIWYPSYADAHGPWGLTAVEDQQLGGLIMWVPGGTVFVIVGVVLMALWLKEVEARTSQ